MHPHGRVAPILAVALLGSAPAAAGGSAGPTTPTCTPAGPEYYALELVPTKNVPGTGLARGTADVSFSRASPYAVAVTADGSYAYDLRVRIERMKRPRRGTLVVWVTTREIDEIRQIGPLDDQLIVSGTVQWNKFLVVITLEPADDPTATTWSGPIVFRGMSRSGMMHTMVGHGAFQQENCAAYGYDD